jgi:hypothetical protein
MTVIRCKFCSLTFSTPASIAEHLALVHPTDQSSESIDSELGILWVDPPAFIGSRTWLMGAERLLDRVSSTPGRWARIRVFKNGTSGPRYRKLLEQYVGDRPFTFLAARIDEMTWGLWARFDGSD